MDTTNKETQRDTPSSSVEADPLVDVTDVANSAGIDLPAYFTQALWERCKLVRDEDDFPGRFEILVYRILKPLALMVPAGLVPHEPEERRQPVQTRCEAPVEVPVEEITVRPVLRSDRNGVVSLVVILEEE